MPEVTLSAGPIVYEDTAADTAPDAAVAGPAAGDPARGGERPTLVLLHGLTIDGSVWREVVAELGDGYRCVMPTLPHGRAPRAHARGR